MAIYVNKKKVAGLGKPGKSAYQIAVDGGYQGTEAEFNNAMAFPVTIEFVNDAISEAITNALEASY